MNTPADEQRLKDTLVVHLAAQYPAFGLTAQLELFALSASEALAREIDEPRAAEKIAARWQQQFDDVRASLEPVVAAAHAVEPAKPAAAPPPRRRRTADDGYRLHVASITYLGDDAAAARAIEAFLRARRARRTAGA